MNFVMCIYQGRYKRRLNRHVVYKAVPSNTGGWFLVDESGVAREYNAKYFVPIELPPEVAATFSVDSKP